MKCCSILYFFFLLLWSKIFYQSTRDLLKFIFNTLAFFATKKKKKEKKKKFGHLEIEVLRMTLRSTKKNFSIISRRISIIFPMMFQLSNIILINILLKSGLFLILLHI